MANKVKYGLRKVYYAKATIGTTGTATYTAPVAIPGAVNLSLDPQGENEPFYADDTVYYVAANNGGYSGTLECALIPDSFRKDCLKETEDAKGVYVEVAGADPNPFALLFEFEGDDKATRHVFYNCIASRSSASGSTTEANKTPQTETLNITALPIYNAALETNIVKASTVGGTDSTAYAAWYTAVYAPTST